MIGRMGKPLFWLVLALPGLLMTASVIRGQSPAGDLLHPSGEMAIRLMIAAMLAGPLAGIFGANRFFRGWLAIRRNLGVAAFGYTMLHLVFYVIDKKLLVTIIEELALASIWTGWLALMLMAVPAAISFDLAIRKMGPRNWKAAQRLAYPSFLLSLVHWVLLEWHWQPALAHLLPLALAWLALLIVRSRSRAARLSAVQ